MAKAPHPGLLLGYWAGRRAGRSCGVIDKSERPDKLIQAHAWSFQYIIFRSLGNIHSNTLIMQP